MNDFKKSLIKALENRREKGNLRRLEVFDYEIDFASNDYLGFGRLNDLKTSSNHAGSSRLIAGTHQNHISTEQKIANFFHSEEALLYNSGYMANLGVIPTLISRNDIIIFDEHCHASMREAITLSKARAVKFKHNDTTDLKRLLDKYIGKQVFILTEGLFSMTGDLAPIEKIIRIAKEYDAKIILDEAHSGGVYGENGEGILQSLCQETVIAKIVTFGKAFGASGAAVLCSDLIKQYLVNFSKSFIYTTSIPVSNVERINHNLDAKKIVQAISNLRSNIRFFKQQVTLPIQSDEYSPIQIVRFSDIKTLKNIERGLKNNGVGIKAIYSPTVPNGEECLRVSLHSFNTKDEISKLTKLLNQSV